MSKREWKPGDVALATIHGQSVQVVRAYKAWITTPAPDDRRFPATYCAFYDAGGEVTDARPLVVIDPENLGDVGRLVEAYVAAMSARGRVGRGPMLTMQAALREFATPTPPRPEEPQGLGAVVEDAEGDRWVLYTNPRNDAPWCNGCASVDYADIAAVRVLAEGWSE